MRLRTLIAFIVSVWIDDIETFAQNYTQQVTCIQYYFDTDPGVGIPGNGSILPISPTANFNQQVSISIPNSLSQGFHNLYVRARDEFGMWSQVERRILYINTIETAAQNISAYQYYFDTDPGVGLSGNGAIVPVSPTSNFNTNVAITVPNSLSTGFHNLYVRTQDVLGRWSLIERRLFYINSSITAAQDVIAYQYYFDSDPGVGVAGNGAIVPVAQTSNYNAYVSINVPNSLSTGFHNLYVRMQDVLGRWSLVERRLFYINSAVTAAQNIDAYQYYFDTDPGVGNTGNGATVPVTLTSNLNASVSITVPNSLTKGFHNLYIRTRDVLGRWSLIERRLFYINNDVTAAQEISAYQYYFDTDPGVGVTGNGAIVPITQTSNFNASVSISVPNSLTTGFHNFFLRTKDILGRWSLIERRVFYINSAQNSSQSVTGLEFYYDNDPGVGNGNPIAVTTAASINSSFPINVPCLSTGTHYLYVRAKDELSRWSIIERDTVIITSGISAGVVTPAGPISICSTDSVTLSANLVSGVSYQWLLNGNHITDSTRNSLVIHTAGNYSLKTICGSSFVTSNVVNVTIVKALTFFVDADVDGYGNIAVTTQACSPPSGFVANNTDCNDANNAIHPNAAETCNGIDDDCDLLIDDADPSVSGRSTWFADGDGDGFGNASSSLLACNLPAGYVSNNTDCNDGNNSIHPGVTEVCNSLDDNCNTQIDEGCNLYIYYADVDGDGYGNPGSSISIINSSPPPGFVTNNSDCNDGNSAVHPGATEKCNGIDDDCDGLTDDADPGITGQLTWYHDVDGDGFGKASDSTHACVQPSGYVSDSTDCNDANGSIHPGTNAGTVSGSSPLCLGSTTTFTSNGNAGGSWSSSNPSVATVIPSTGFVSAVSQGTTNIIYTNSGCGISVSASKPLIVSPNVVAGTVSGTNPICLGETAFYTSSGTAGGSWSSSDPSVATVNTLTGLVTGVSGGSSIITYLVNTGCGNPVSSSKTINITGIPVGFAGTVSGTSPLCIGSSVFYNSNGDAGGSWSSSNNSIATVNSLSGEVTAVGAGIVNIKYSVNGCHGAVVSQKSLTVNPNAAPGIVSGTNPLCTGTSTTYLSNGTFGGNWSSTDPSVASINSVNGIVSALSNGMTTIKYSVTGCGGTFVSVQPLTVSTAVSPGDISGSTLLCITESATFTSNGTAGGNWSSSNSGVVSINILTGVAIASSPGTATITYKVTGCNGNLSASRIVTVVPTTSAGTIGGFSQLCIGASSTYSSSGTAGGLWSSNNTPVANVDQLTGLVTGVSGGTATIRYDVSGCGNNYSATKLVTVAGHPPSFTFSGNPDFINSVVFPADGEPEFNYRFEVSYINVDGIMPASGFPRLMLDFEGNGIFTDPKDLNIIMTPLNPLDLDVTNGKTYYVVLTGLAIGTNWTANFYAKVAGGCEIQSAFAGPNVIKTPNLSIFADDITFSDNHPNASSPDTVYAVIHNDSSSEVNNIVVHLINQYQPSTVYPDVMIPSIGAFSDVKISWPIITPALIAWVPMQVVIDYTDVVDETNELDNQAIRPFINGNFTVPGSIAISAGGSSTICQGGFYNVCGSASYENTAVVLQDPSVAGATVTVTVNETGQMFTGYTNSYGYYCVSFLAPELISSYSLSVSVTDFTIEGNSSSAFSVVYCPPPPPPEGPDLRSLVTLDASEVFVGSPITGTVKIYNEGNKPAGPSIEEVYLASNGSSQQFSTPALVPGAFYLTTFSFVSPLDNGSEGIISMADATDVVTELREFNNSSRADIRICPLQPDLFPSGYDVTYTPTIYLCESLISFNINNPSCVPITQPFDVQLQVFQNSVMVHSETRTVLSGVSRDNSIGVGFSNPFPNAGSFTVNFLVDINNSITELNESNNIRSKQFNVIECKPDLSISSECNPVTPLDPSVPGFITVHTTLSNSGHLIAAAPFIVDFEIGGNHYPIPITSSMPVNSSIPVDVSIPTPPFGCPVLTVTADATNVLDEYNEGNTGHIPLSWDFSLGRICWDPILDEDIPNPNFWELTHNAGSPVAMSIGLWSASTYIASAVHTKFEVSGPQISGWLDLGFATNAFVGSTFCTSEPCPLQVHLPNYFVFPSEGVYQVRITADGDSTYGECNEANNDTIVEVTIVDSPDYRSLSRFIAPSLLNPEVGEAITIDVTYENIGATNIVDSMDFQLKVDDLPHQKVRVKGLFSGNRFTAHFSNPWASLLPGLHVIRAIIDSHNDIPEANEFNNQATRSFVVGKAADLYFQSFAPDNSFPLLGQSISINTRVGNKGVIDCEGDVLFFYLNDSGDSIPIGTIHISVAKGDSTTITLPWTVLDNNTKLIARIVNITILQLNYDNKEATALLGDVSVSIASTPACYGGGDGKLTASMPGGKPPYTFRWNTGYVGQTLNAPPGIYSVIATDAIGTIRIDQAEIKIIFTPAYYEDIDGDGFGNPASIIEECEQPPGYVSDYSDCNDLNGNIHPGAVEVCNGIDDNCNGQIDEGVLIKFYVDEDGDLFGNKDVFIEACTAPPGYVLDNTDCNDARITAHPGATEVCNGIDDNCNLLIDEGVSITFYRDLDSDGYGNPNATTQECNVPTGFVPNNSDCNDSNFNIHPGVNETCNGIDDNCNGKIDEGVLLSFYSDADGDGFGNPAIQTYACSAPLGFVINKTDCNDALTSVHPGAIEVCNSTDDNCNGQVDEGVKLTFYRDADGDGFGNAIVTIQSCSAPAGYVSNSKDCNDALASVYPGATEVCNTIDDNCNGKIDEGVKLTFYRDGDGDGYGNVSSSIQACSPPAGYVTISTDCNDALASVYPGATEVCNSFDDNCNGVVDEGVKLTFYRDVDGDGFGNVSVTIQACSPPSGYVTNSTDCNDALASVYPGATEVCNNIDDNCNGVVDEGVKLTFYRDVDGDGFGNVSVTIQACSPPSGYVTNSTDCNDALASVYPGATEVCNNIDDNCNGIVDEGVKLTFYRDVDGDGFGNVSVTIQACSPPSGYVTNSTDCNDALASIYPGATEVCNSIDDNCNGVVDEGVKLTFYRDVDGDGFGNVSVTIQACSPPAGYVTNSTDCNDAFTSVYPEATEACNNIDDNCNGVVDEGVKQIFYRDADGDGFGNPLLTITGCAPPSGYVLPNTDCNDANILVHPGVIELCNLLDDNCDNAIDEGCNLCKTCNGNTIVVDTSVTIDFNVTTPAYSGDQNLKSYFTFSKTGTAQEIWKAIFDVGSNKLLIKNGATITVKTVPASGSLRASPGIVIKSACDFEMENNSHLYVSSYCRNAGEILIQVNGNIIINGEIRNQVTGSAGLPGPISITSKCGDLTIGQTAEVFDLGIDPGGGTITLSTCGAGIVNGDIVISGMVKSVATACSGTLTQNRPNINVVSINGAVTVNANTTEPLYDEYCMGTDIFDLWGGLLSWVQANANPGKITVQAKGDITVNGHGKDPTGYDRSSFGAIAAISTGIYSPGGIIDVRSTEGRIIANNRAFDVHGKNLYTTNFAGILLYAKQNILLNRPGANSSFNPVVDASTPLSNGKGGKNEIRSFSGSIQIGSTATVSASGPSGSCSVQGSNKLVSCLGVTNIINVTPADVIMSDNSGYCVTAAPTALFASCASVPGANYRMETFNSEIGNENMIMFYPNPTDGKGTLAFSSEESGRYVLLIVDMTGQVIWRDELIANAGENRYDIDLSDSRKGLYIISVLNSKENRIVRVVVE